MLFGDDYPTLLEYSMMLQGWDAAVKIRIFTS